MSRFFKRHLGVLTFLWLAACAVGFGAESTASDSHTDVTDGARRIWSAIEVVLDHHVAAPTRQQLLLEAVKELKRHSAEDDAELAQLARRVSNLNGQSDTEQFLAEQLKQAQQHSKKDVAWLERGALFAALRAVPGNPNYTPPEESAVQELLLNNRYVGIGIAMSTVDEYPAMHDVFFRGPAHRGGALKGDLMVSIDGRDMKGMALEDVIPMLRGQGGVPVSIVVRQPGSEETRTLNIVRGEVPIETIEGVSRKENEEWDHAIAGVQGIAYIKIIAIRGSTVGELRDTARRVEREGFHGVVLDLRGTMSGEVRHAAMVADALLEEMPIGSILNRGRREEFASNADHLFPDQPMAVLIDRTTSGQIEWLAASLRQRRDTILMGSQTVGMGFVVEPVKLSDGATLQLWTGIYYRPDGRSLVSKVGEAEVNPMLAMRRTAANGAHYLAQVQSAAAVNWNGLSPDVHITDRAIESAAAKLARGTTD